MPQPPSGRRAEERLVFWPGMVYVGHYFEVGGAAEFPADSFTRRQMGSMAIFDLFINNVVLAFGRMVTQ